MVKRINEAFSDKEHKLLLVKKEELRKKLDLSKLNWHDFILKLGEIE